MSRQLIYSLLLSCLCGLVVTSHSHAAIYKWVDEQNQIHYSEQPENNAKNYEKVTNVQVKTKPSTQPTTENGNSELETLKAKLKEHETAQSKTNEEVEQQQNIDKINAYNCKVAKTRVETLERHRVRNTGANGQVRVMPEDERQAELAKAKLDVAQYCKGI